MVAPDAPAAMSSTSSSPTFSVIIAVYQAAQYVGAALASVMAQTTPAFEVIICDDGSTDDLAAALAPFLDRVTLLHQENRGEAAAKNRAALTATGEYVVILDADDVWEPERLAALGTLASLRPDLDILTTDAHFEVDGQVRGRFYDDQMRFPVDQQPAEILDRCFVMPHAAVRRRRWLELGGFDGAMRPASDWDFYIRAVLTGSRVGIVDAPLARYRLVPHSMSADRARSLRARVTVLDKTATSGALPPELESALHSARRRHERRASLAEAEEALRSGGPDARRAALALARSSGQPAVTRLKAAFATVAPGVARRVLSTRAPGRLARPHT